MATEQEIRAKVVNTAKAYLGCKKGGSLHKKIVDIFNTVKPDGDAMTYSAPWCAAFASGVEIQALGKTDAKKIVPLSYNCDTIINKAKKLGCWVENDAYTPSPADWILYDWQDNGAGDNQGYPDHVGIVEKVTAQQIYVIEGNKGSASECARRILKINSQYIRGFVHIQYSKIATGSASSSTANKTASTKKSVATIAQEVIEGKWGNGTARQQKLKAAGYNYSEVQAKVNELLGKNTTAKAQGSGKVIAKAGLNVRTRPSTTTGKVILALTYGTKVTCYGKSGDWWKISATSQEWCSSKYIK